MGRCLHGNSPGSVFIFIPTASPPQKIKVAAGDSLKHKHAVDLRKISQTSLAKLSGLHSQPPIPREFAVKLLTGLADSGEAAVIPELADLLIDQDSIVRAAAQHAVAKLLWLVPPRSLPELDERMRGDYYNVTRGQQCWCMLQAGNIPKLVADHDRSPVLGLATMHRNGRVREAALLKLAEQKTGSELPFLLLRLNDWVESIRKIARDAVSRRLTPEYAPHFLDNLTLVMRLEQCGRDKHTWLFPAIARLLSRAECEPVLRRGLKSSDRFIRSSCLRLVVNNAGTAADSALRDALGDTDPMLRLWAIKQLLANNDPETLLQRHPDLLRDMFMPVRREALQSLAAHELANARPALMNALLDRNVSVRDVARFYLQRLGDFDAGTFYRQCIRLPAEQQSFVAIYGLGESGSSTDADLLAPYLSSPEISKRRAAITAIARLAPRDYLNELMECLADASPGVSTAACRGLLASGTALDRDRVRSLLREDPRPFVRKNALRLGFRFSKWEQLPLILGACRDPEEVVSSPARAAVQNWVSRYNRTFIAPQPARLEEAERELRQSQEFLSYGTARELFALLSEWRRS